MTITIRTMIVAAVLFCSTKAFAQSSVSTPLGILSVADTATTAKIAKLQGQIKALDSQIAKQEKNLNCSYRDVTIDVELAMNLREDSIYMSMLSKRYELNTRVNELRTTGIRSVLNRISAVPQRRNTPAATPNKKRNNKPQTKK